MSRLLIVTRPTLVSGFRLAGVDAFAVADSVAAQQLIARWLAAGETGLLAIDEELLAGFDEPFRQKLAAAEHLPHLALPVGQQAGSKQIGRSRIAELLRKTIGFHMMFQGEQG